jgi:G protein-coupled glucose receptor regulating Gpa2
VSAVRSIHSPDQHKFIRTHVAAYFLSLLLCDLAQGIGSLLNVRWITQGGVEVGSYCTAQAVIKQTGNVGTALWSFVIAVHTFDVLFLRWHIADYVCYGTLIAVWSFLGFIVILGTAVVEKPERGPFYGISGYWCWITPAYPVERYALEYLFMFASAGLSFILYSLIFLRLRGNISVSGWHFRFHHSRNGSGQDTSNNGIFHDGRRDPHLMQVARQMLWYPVAYTILVLPIAAARFSAFNGKDVPFGVTIFTASIFMLSGFVNAILFTTTRRVIQFPSSWKTRLFSFSQRSSDPEGSPMTGPYISTTTTTQIDEPDSPTARTPIMRGPQAPLTSTSPIPFTTYTSFTIPPHQPHQPHHHSGDVNTAQSTADFGSLHGKRPQWVGHGRSVSGDSARSGSSAATLTTRDDPNAFSGTPLVKNASAEGRSGYPYVYRRERSGSEGSIQYQAGNASPSGDSNSSQRVQKALPSLPAGSQ